MILPDLHGSLADQTAASAAIRAIRTLRPREVVLLGDMVDVAGAFSRYPARYQSERYSYVEDIRAGARFVSSVRRAAGKRADVYYIEGNHEQRAEKWVTETFGSGDDGELVLGRLSPERLMELADLGIEYIRTDRHYRGAGAARCAAPGTIKLDGCYFTHGYALGRGAMHKLLDDYNDNVVCGHLHQSMSATRRRMDGVEIGAYCPGTLSQLHMMYRHNAVTAWSHGIAVQWYGGGRLHHHQVPIRNGRAYLPR